MNFKALLEKRNDLIEKMGKMLEVAEKENRAMSADENTSYEAMNNEIADIDKTLRFNDEWRNFEKTDNKENKNPETDDVKEARAFSDYIRTGEIRTDANFTVGNNGVVIPKTIAKRIIETVENICPIYAKATHFTVKGELVFPKYDEATQSIKCAYSEEFTELTATAAKFTSISLKGYLAAALTKISRSLINNSEFDLVSYVVSKVALAIARFLEKELILGTSGKCTGLVSCTQSVTTAAATAITTDELIDLQLTVPQIYQNGAGWIMNLKTFGAIRKLKDTNDQYLLNKDITTEFGYTLLGKPVMISDVVADVASAAIPVFYGDFSGLYVKVVEESAIQILTEKYATEHAIGVVDWIEIDSKIVEEQKIAKLVMKTSA